MTAEIQFFLIFDDYLSFGNLEYINVKIINYNNKQYILRKFEKFIIPATTAKYNLDKGQVGIWAYLTKPIINIVHVTYH